MKILGISDSHEAHAALFIDGKIVSAIAEERMNRIKAYQGYPRKAINRVLEINNIKPCELDYIIFAGFSGGLFHSIMKPGSNFSTDDWKSLNEKYWKSKLIFKKKLDQIDEFEVFKDKFKFYKRDDYFNLYLKAKKLKKNERKNKANLLNLMKKVRIETISKHLKIVKEKIHFIRHEECHQYYAIFSNTNQSNKKKIIFTAEGGGDDSSATISVVGKYNIVKEIYKTNEFQLGRLYRYITLLLGMKPSQHEYKVMGLAPYSTSYHGTKSYNFFKKFNSVRGMKIVNNKFYKDTYFTSRDQLEGQRFDGIAWGLQKALEDFMVKWVKNSIKKIKCKNIYFSGGVAQNIKMLKVINDKIKSNYIWAGPISGDGSLAIGAIWAFCKKLRPKMNFKNLESIYLGSEIENKEINKEYKKIDKKKFRIINNISNKKIARWLFQGKIIARCVGKMEFGQRALGNRSILADPTILSSVEKINKKIKFRDFWMPFTPTILYEKCKNLLNNRNNIYSPYMCMAFDLKKKFISDFEAAIHPSDKTVRPQMLKKKDNPEYYNLIKEFEKLGKPPALLNTSYNLHGDAIVENVKQAISTFKKTDLDVLILNKTALVRLTK